MGDGRPVDLVIRLDAGPGIGSGHFMRCQAYAQAAEELGLSVRFAVSDAESLSLAQRRGIDALVLEGCKELFEPADGEALSKYAASAGAVAVLVDSYAVSERFFSAIRDSFDGRVAYVDDLYLFSSGRLELPMRFPVTHVVNYSFGARLNDYRSLYGDSIDFLIGPQFAPIRKEFTACPMPRRNSVSRVLVTSGATNPDCFLERVANCCSRSLPNATIDIVVGPLAQFDDSSMRDDSIVLHQNVANMSPLMSKADLSVSAAGSTLYELSCMGVPTIAIPLVENQITNARSFEEAGAGMAVRSIETFESDLENMLQELAVNLDLRMKFSSKASNLVDGYGASRVVGSLFSL